MSLIGKKDSGGSIIRESYSVHSDSERMLECGKCRVGSIKVQAALTRSSPRRHTGDGLLLRHLVH